MTAKASIVVVNWNTRELVLQCVQSIKDSTTLPVQIVVVDNGSSDGSADAIAAQHPDVTLLRSDENLGFARGNNLGFRHCVGEHVVLLNSDTIVKPGAIEALVRALDERPEVGIVGGHQIDGDGCFTPTGYWFPSLWIDLAMASGLLSLRPWMLENHLPLGDVWLAVDTREVDWLGASFVAVRRAVIDRVGPLPDEFFMYGEDLEWSWRIKNAGWKVLYLHGPPIVHLEGRSANQLFKSERANRMLDGLYLFARRHRNPVGWRLGWLALAGHWQLLAMRWSVRARLRGDPQAKEVARSLRSYARRHVDHVLGRLTFDVQPRA